ncbi:unnamed protein product [Adineta steineri]|uniref:Uncharacterized protein n=1 Tax=Adineta steineri TaxID=433720 RepID=A0A815FM98_9BILA|nr:unnamed protein product [Adineta steineri]
MAEINTFPKELRTNSVSSVDSSIHESSSMPASPRSTSPLSAGWGINYKRVHKPASKGVWGGYETKEEFMTMHLR